MHKVMPNLWEKITILVIKTITSRNMNTYIIKELVQDRKSSRSIFKIIIRNGKDPYHNTNIINKEITDL